MLVAPYYNYGIMGPKTLFYFLRPLYGMKTETASQQLVLVEPGFVHTRFLPQWLLVGFVLDTRHLTLS